jgi:hypothetical protein
MPEIHDEKTLRKVYMGLAAAGVTGQAATDVVFEMQNLGILFREHCVCGEDPRVKDGHRLDGPCVMAVRADHG